MADPADGASEAVERAGAGDRANAARAPANPGEPVAAIDPVTGPEPAPSTSTSTSTSEPAAPEPSVASELSADRASAAADDRASAREVDAATAAGRADPSEGRGPADAVTDRASAAMEPAAEPTVREATVPTDVPVAEELARSATVNRTPALRVHSPTPPAVRRPGRVRRIARRIVGALKTAAEVGLILGATGALVMWCSIPSTSRLAENNPTSTAFIDLRRDQAEAAGKPFVLRWEWRSLNRISRYLRAAVIYAEDYNFHRHTGVDWDAIEDALEANLDRGTLSIGGSTITQQLAKNLYLSPDRSFIRKAREMLIAFSLEDHLDKQRILELYLNVVEWGDGVFGAEAAARHWFKHSAQTLTPAEAVRLAIALPNPIDRAPNVHTPRLTKKAVRIIRLLRMQGLIDEHQERDALDQVGASHVKVLPSRRRPGHESPSIEPALPASPTTPESPSPPTAPAFPGSSSPPTPTPLELSPPASPSR